MGVGLACGNKATVDDEDDDAETPGNLKTVKLVKTLGLGQKGKSFNPEKKTRGIMRHGYFGKHQVKCHEDHVMPAKVTREILHYLRCSDPASSGCQQCESDLDASDTFYRCAECDINLCVNCSREQLGLLVKDDALGTPVEVLAGDILFCDPGILHIHHVILATSSLERDFEMDKYLQVPPGAEVWSCSTVESTAQVTGDTTNFYQAKCYFARDPHERTLHIVGDSPSYDTNSVQVSETPIPVKVMLSTARREYGGIEVDPRLFQEAADIAAEASQFWSIKTALKAGYFYQELLEQSKYPTRQDRAKLWIELQKAWDRPPICASVPIKVWQQYFKETSSDSDEAVQKSLTYMPFIADHATPAALVKGLSASGWIMLDSFLLSRSRRMFQSAQN